MNSTRLSGLLLAIAATALGFYVLWQAASFSFPSVDQGTRVAGDGFPKVLIDQTGRRVVLPQKPTRIVSVTLATDEILLALVGPSRLLGVTYLAVDERISNMTQEAAAVPHQVRADPEQIISLQPDLVFVASYLRGEFIRLLQAAGLVLFQFQEYDSIAEVEQNIRLIGQVVGEEARAEALVAAMEARLQALAEQLRPIGTRPRVLYWGSQGYTAGRMTSMDDLITYAGGENLAATYGLIGSANLSAEQVLAMNPQVIVSGSFDQDGQRGLPPVLMHPALQGTDAVQHGRVYTIPSRYLVTISQFIVDGVEVFARVLHGTALRPRRAAMKPQGVSAWASVALLGGLLGLVGRRRPGDRQCERPLRAYHCHLAPSTASDRGSDLDAHASHDHSAGALSTCLDGSVGGWGVGPVRGSDAGNLSKPHGRSRAPWGVQRGCPGGCVGADPGVGDATLPHTARLRLSGRAGGGRLGLRFGHLGRQDPGRDPVTERCGGELAERFLDLIYSHPITGQHDP